MTEYIEKWSVVNRLIDLENELQRHKPFHGFKHAMYRKICEAEIAIGKMPAADVAPVRHGRWISLTECANEGVYCSICEKKVWKSDYAWCSKRHRNKLQSNYCPNCGAKMDLEVLTDGC